jgi:hypothetical protein
MGNFRARCRTRCSLVRLKLVTALLGASLGCGRSAEPVPPSLADFTAGARPYLNMPADAHGEKPTLLSQTGAFADTPTLTPSQGLLPYDINVPFWSDGADKRRWLALPSAGSGGAQRVRFSPTGEWQFPRGTVFVKHFETVDDTRPGGKRRLETRLLVCDSVGGVYGVSYKWRPDQADAERIDHGHREMIGARPASGAQAAYHYFPGPDDCRKCHLPTAGGVLGVNTRQLNRTGLGAEANYLVAWSRLGLLDPPVCEEELPQLPKLPRIDQAGVTPEDRARAFLDANCGYCHRPGGAAADFDARWETPLARQAMIDAPARINLGIDRARQIAPNDPWRSIVLVRLNTLEQTKMPPLAHEQTDRRGVEILRKWIASLPGPPVVAPPALEPKGGDYKEPIWVRITHPNTAAEVRYTLDGTPPGPSSLVYRGPLQLSNSATVRARAFRPGHTRSIVVQDTFIIGD